MRTRRPSSVSLISATASATSSEDADPGGQHLDVVAPPRGSVSQRFFRVSSHWRDADMERDLRCFGSSTIGPCKRRRRQRQRCGSRLSHSLRVLFFSYRPTCSSSRWQSPSLREHTRYALIATLAQLSAGSPATFSGTTLMRGSPSPCSPSTESSTLLNNFAHSITENEGRMVQDRSEGSILREIERIRDKTCTGWRARIRRSRRRADGHPACSPKFART